MSVCVLVWVGHPICFPKEGEDLPFLLLFSFLVISFSPSYCIVKAKHSRQKDVHVWFRGMDVLLLLLDLFHPPALLQEHDTCFRSLCAPCAGSGFLCFVGFTWWYHVCLSCVCVCGCILGLRQCCKAVRGREERRGNFDCVQTLQLQVDMCKTVSRKSESGKEGESRTLLHTCFSTTTSMQEEIERKTTNAHECLLCVEREMRLHVRVCEWRERRRKSLECTWSVRVLRVSRKQYYTWESSCSKSFSVLTVLYRICV